MEINKIYNEDCLEGMKTLSDNSVDSVVTDPPYELGFMGKSWDSTGIAYNVEMWKEVLRVLKPGGHLLAFGGTRTYHRMACAIEDAGFEIRDQMQWIYGSGFPKSMDIKKKVESGYNCKLESQSVSTAEKISNLFIGQDEMAGQDFVVEIVLPIVKRGGGIIFVSNVEKNSILQSPMSIEQTEETKGLFAVTNVRQNGKDNLQVKIILIGKEEDLNGQTDISRLTSTENIDLSMMLFLKKKLDENLKNGNDVITLMELKMIIDLKILNLLQYLNTLKSILTVNHTALKPANEPIVVARKPLSEKTIAANVLRWGTGGLNIDGCRIGNETEHVGRFPANIILDEAAGELLDAQSGQSTSKQVTGKRSGKDTGRYGAFVGQDNVTMGHNDSGGASRFFYCAKAAKKERGEGNVHPTVKPLKLMKYLVKLVTPPKGVVLDPFIGSGTTAIACMNTQRNFIGFEMDKGYYDIACKRIDDHKEETDDLPTEN